MAPPTAQAFSDQMANAIKGHVEQIMSQSVAAAREPVPEHLSVAEVKEQIMASLEVLWSMLKAREVPNHGPFRHQGTIYSVPDPNKPKFHLVTVATGAKTSARVLCGGPIPYQEAFINGPEASCHRTAYEKLLQMLDIELKEKWDTFVALPRDTKQVNMGEGGLFFVSNDA